MKSGDVCSKLVVFRERLRAIRFCTLDRPLSKYPIDLNLGLPSTVFLLCASTGALSDAALSKTSSSNPLPDTQRGDRNQADGSGRELGDESLADMIYCRSCTQTAAVIDMVQLNATSSAKFRNERPTSPVWVLSCSSSLHGLLYDLSQPEKVQWYFLFAFFTSEPLTKTNPDFFFEFWDVCGDSASDPRSYQEASLCSWLDSDVESCRSKVSDATLFFRLPRTVVVVRDMNFERAELTEIDPCGFGFPRLDRLVVASGHNSSPNSSHTHN